MPKVLLYIKKSITWIFLFYATDFNENRPHIHIGKKGTDNYCKLWLTPKIEVAKKGDLTDRHIKEVLAIADENRELLINQWDRFKQGKQIKIITIKK